MSSKKLKSLQITSSKDLKLDSMPREGGESRFTKVFGLTAFLVCAVTAPCNVRACTDRILGWELVLCTRSHPSILAVCAPTLRGAVFRTYSGGMPEYFQNTIKNYSSANVSGRYRTSDDMARTPQIEG